jgi:hypothetical protein
MSGEHTLWSPSGAKRWSCHGAMAACVGIPNTAGEAAALGTAKHALGAWCLSNPDRQSVDAHCGQATTADGFTFEIDDDFCDHVNMYVNNARLVPGVQSYEIRVDTSRVLGIPNQGGTIDLLVEDEVMRTLTVGDAKFGWEAIEPDAEQLIIYAAAALDERDPQGKKFDEVRLMIFQPARSNIPAEVTLSRSEINARMDVIAADAQAGNALIGAAPEVIEAAKRPSPAACKWCPINSTCEAKRNQIADQFPLTLAQADYVDGNAHVASAALEDTSALDPELVRLAQDLERIDDIEKWCRERRALALRFALAGTPPPGWRMVEGKKGNRRFVAPALAMYQAEDDIGDAAYEPRELKSPAQMEKAYKKAKKAVEWQLFSDMNIDQPKGAASLARISEGGVPLAPIAEFGLAEVQS